MKSNSTFAGILIATMAILASGCTSNNGVKVAEQARLAYDKFQSQPRVAPVVELAGTNMLITMSGVSSFKLSMPLQPLEAQSKYPDIAATVVNGVKEAVLGGVGIWGLTTVATHDPQVVNQPAPVIVEKQVLVPVAGAAP